MKIQITNDNDCVTVVLDGRLDTTTSPRLEKELHETLNSATTNLVFDLKALEYMSSAGLRIVMATDTLIRMENGGSMKLIHVNEEIMEVLEMTGLCDVLTIE